VQRLAELCIRRPVFASMLILTLVVVGIASYRKLGVDRFPAVDLPTVTVRTSLPGASPEEIETQISQKIEEVVNTVEGIDQLRSISGEGTSVVLITFDLEREIDAATQDVRDRVATVLRDLPREAFPPIVSKFDNDQTPVLTLAISGDRPLRELTELADKQVKIPLERVAGVGEVKIVGGLERSINVWIDPDRLAAYQLPITAVRDAVARQNAEVPGGNITGDVREESLRTLGRIADPSRFQDLVIATIDGVPVRVRDVGRAEDGTKERRSAARLDGQPTVTLEVRRQSGANSVAVIEEVKSRLATLRDLLPSDVRVEVIRDQSRFIYEALREIDLHLVLGSLLACLVVLLFMKDWRSTLIAGIAIPTSVIATFGAMKAFGFTLNSVTMLALVLMVGIIIDDAIVVLENVFRCIEEKGLDAFAAAREGTREIALAVLATTLSLAVVFVPVSFMGSVSGRFLHQFGITAAVAVMVSLLVSFTLTPTMSARLLRADPSNGAAPRSRRGFYQWIERIYLALLRGAMRFRFLVVLLVIATIASIPHLYSKVRQEYIPSDVDEAEFDVNVTGPEGLSITGMDEVMKAVEAEVAATPQVRLVLATLGGSFIGGANTAQLYVRIAPHSERRFSIGRLWRATLDGDPGAAFRGNITQREVMSDLRRRLAKFKELRFSVRNAPSFQIGGGPFEIDFGIVGPELEALAKYSEELRDRAKALGGIVDVDTTLRLNKPELRVNIDRDRAADLGVEVQDIALALRLMVGGDERVSRFRDAALNDDYDVQVRLDEQWRSDASTVARLYVPSRRGGLIRLDNVVDLETAATASRIDRLDRQRVVSLRASVGPGFALADRIAALRGAVADMRLPATYSTRVSGRGRELERTGVEFLAAFALSIVLMYIILAAQFESIVHPLTILLSLPVALPFGLLSLQLTGNTLNLYSALGVLVLFGVVKKNAILQIDHMNKLREAGRSRFDAIIEGNRDRLRPILMTTFALVAGMLPLALGTGPGSEERRAIAVVVIGGQTLSLLLTLLVTPVAYSLFDDLRRERKVAKSSDSTLETS
jgi:hydrophobic/amphiphilic exporter-1 (mainly G- bacteria), HAE1 family